MLAAISAALILDSAAWLLACQRLEEGLHTAIAAAPSAGWVVTTGAPVRAGWPFAAALVVPSVSVASDPAVTTAPLVWRAERLVLHLDLTRPTTLLVAAEGGQTLQSGGQAPLPFQARRMELAVRLDQRSPPELEVADLRAELAAGSWTVGVARAVFPPDAAVLDAGAIRPPAPLESAMGAPIDSVHLRAAIAPGIPVAATMAEQARLWRDAGGRLDLPEIALHWASLDLAGHATLRLDPALQPEGDGAIAVSGLAPTLDALARGGVLPARTVTAAKAVLVLLSAPAMGQPVTLPVQLQGSVLVVARFPLLRVPPLDWGPP